MSIIGSNILAGASGQGGEYTIEESLRFNASQSSYLSRTPASAGNRKTWTFSAWVKRGVLSTPMVLFQAGSTGSEFTINWRGFDAWDFYEQTSSTQSSGCTTNAVYRDPSAWYHIVFAYDTTQATSTNRWKLYINGTQVTSFSATQYPTLNYDGYVNSTVTHYIGIRSGTTTPFDGYMTEVNFIDGQALDPSSFGEFDSVTGVWKPAKYTGTYGTNGFYLPMQLDNTVEGFNTVTWVGNDSTHNITGVGFSPDLVWTKARSAGNSHTLMDSVRGASKRLYSNLTNAEDAANGLLEFTSDGFVMGNNATSHNMNGAGVQYVAWCWDAGSSTVSNTDGSITSSVRANPAYGFSVVTYTGNGVASTIGHGLGVAPSMIITKVRNNAGGNWAVYHSAMGNTGGNWLNLTNAFTTQSLFWNNTSPTSSVFSVGSNNTDTNWNTYNFVAYCFSEVAGFSKFGSYTGNGSTSGPTITTGFKPAMVLIKCSSGAFDWWISDTTRSVSNTADSVLLPNSSSAEINGGGYLVDFLDDGFQLRNIGSATNGSGQTYIYMAFKDTREYAYWLDDSGNNNDWQPNGGITTESTVTDTPTPYADGGNYATLNKLSQLSTSTTISNANLSAVIPASSATGKGVGTIAVSSGKWYWETTYTTSNGNYLYVGMGNPSDTNPRWLVRGSDGEVLGPTTSGSATAIRFVQGDVIGIALDADNGKWFIRVNGTWQLSADPVAGTGFVHSGLYGELAPRYENATGSATQTIECNFGQRPFAYTPPTGFLPLHTGNLPDSAIVDGSQYFNTVLYTGNGSAQSITGVGFQPDFLWAKRRTAGSHALADSVRGATKLLFTNSTAAEETQSLSIQSFDADGFTVNNYANVNNSGEPLVAWNWKANGSGVSNTDGSITSTVSANPTAGFSIVTYTGTGATATVGHGLGVAPSMIIWKRRDSTSNWYVYHKDVTPKALVLETTAGAYTTTLFNGFVSASDTLTLGAQGFNISGASHLAYCFADVEGYSKFGCYTGNGSADGPFVYTGFRPAFIMWKRTDSSTGGEWVIQDTTRREFNPVNVSLYPNLSNAEATGETFRVQDTLSNGFKIRASAAQCNASGGTYIYAAFAENPFKNSLAR